MHLIQRLNVAINVVDVLEYLHHSCQPPIVHYDMKPSNVLLDDDMNAHSLATSVGVIKGTNGYVPPEYDFGSKMSTMGDVYSYGILVLELLTRMRPVDESLKDDMIMRKFVETYAFPERIMEVIVDPTTI
ncbi:probable LRR receptor-like serine/threonine-protein kinase At3g47570 [Dioscorea cayenensis subsp. rotundata]|uniref:Probable LRR receptor-like serine/threonine-protein kinase At3g47570 n=1 Tax=Dioscorea cayennensis subsp. rotundata TaxID=55577 RepID=A0AB40C780_DIOCR|nr:probable LRR receptor-like serine/threonine-protein kinase At3g47570 [Dioscorea cayenensis subsp. rotundata]